MPTFVPFRGLRYSPAAGPAEQLVSPPYDVFGIEERGRLADGNTWNIVHLDYPVEAEGPDRYINAARTLDDWRNTGILVQDGQPTFYVYRMEFVDSLGRQRDTVGVIGALAVDEPDVLPHEQTTPKAKSDRLDLLTATRSNLSPVWGLSLSQGLTSVLDEPGRILARVHDSQGVLHTLEEIVDPDRLLAVTSTIGDAPVLIADGHHRLAVSRAYLSSSGTGVAGAKFTMTYVAELTDTQLSIEAIHRLVTGADHESILLALGDHYDVVGTRTSSDSILRAMRTDDLIAVVAPGGTTTLLKLRPGSLDGVRPIDSARLEAALERLPLTFSYQHGLADTLTSLETGPHTAAILLNPVPLDQIRDVATSGQLMPPKSTFFTPKLLTGLVIRELDEQRAIS